MPPKPKTQQQQCQKVICNRHCTAIGIMMINVKAATRVKKKKLIAIIKNKRKQRTKIIQNWPTWNFNLFSIVVFFFFWLVFWMYGYAFCSLSPPFSLKFLAFCSVLKLNSCCEWSGEKMVIFAAIECAWSLWLCEMYNLCHIIKWVQLNFAYGPND